MRNEEIEELTHVVVETGELVPAPTRIEQFGEHSAPVWEFGPGDFCPQTGEIVPEGGYSTVMCCSDVRPVPKRGGGLVRWLAGRKFRWFQRRMAESKYLESGL